MSTSSDDHSTSTKRTATKSPSSNTISKLDKIKHDGKSSFTNSPVKSGPLKKRQRSNLAKVESESDTQEDVNKRTSGSKKGKQIKPKTPANKVSPQNRKRPHHESDSEDSAQSLSPVKKGSKDKSSVSSTNAPGGRNTRRKSMLSQLGLTEKEIRELIQEPRRGNKR